MVVLNFYGKIEPICISEKLKLFISNLPEEEMNEWQTELAEEFEFREAVSNISNKRLGLEPEDRVIQLYTKVLPNVPQPECIDSKVLKQLAENMICIYFDYQYSDMPLGGWETNCFDGRFCEEAYAEKVVDFINFASYFDRGHSIFPEPTPQWIYSSDHDEINLLRLFWGGEDAAPYIKSLKEWGKLFDNLLVDKNDYLLLDYLFNSIHKDAEYNEYHLLKDFSLCQLFLENKHESELDDKLPQFIDDSDEQRRILSAQYFRKLRNKLAHGDFTAFEKVIEEYTSDIMDGHFSFDYSEYSRKNWAILHICCQLDDIIRRLIYLLLTDRQKLQQIKNS